MFALKVKVEEAKEPITIEVNRSLTKIKKRAAWYSRLSGVESVEIINQNPPKGTGREAQKLSS